MNTLKSIGAVLGGFITVVVLSVASDFILETSGFFPSTSEPVAFTTWMLALALAYRSIYTVAGGYVTAQLAPSHPFRHVVALALLGFVAGVTGAVVGWNLSDHWYPVALAITGPLFVLLGGWLRIKTEAKQSDSGVV